MNKVVLIGRLTDKPELGYTPNTQTAVTKFTIAVDRHGDGADFIRITAYGKQAENTCRYMDKGRQIAIEGRIQTGSYKKDGATVYTTDVVASRVEFLDSKPAGQPVDMGATKAQAEDLFGDDVPFTYANDGMPF